MRFGDLLTKQSKMLLENKQYAIMYAVILSVIPFIAWLSVALVALVTLRKGAKSGFEVMLPALVVHSIPWMMLLPVESAIVNTLIAYLPCYIAALTLRATGKWQMAFGVILLQALCASLFVHVLIPNFTMDQMQAEYKNFQQLFDVVSARIDAKVLAELFLGIQVLSVAISSVISILFARSVQSKLFMPGGFKEELSGFRSGKIALIFLMAISFAAYHENYLGIDLLPLMMCYFLSSSFSLAYYLLASIKQTKVVFILGLLVFIKPTFFLFAYIIIGSLDSIFNFRLYLPPRVRGST